MVTIVLSALTLVSFGAGIAWAKSHNDTIADGFIRIHRDKKNPNVVHIDIDMTTNPFVYAGFLFLVAAAVAGILQK